VYWLQYVFVFKQDTVSVSGDTLTINIMAIIVNISAVPNICFVFILVPNSGLSSLIHVWLNSAPRHTKIVESCLVLAGLLLQIMVFVIFVFSQIVGTTVYIWPNSANTVHP